MSRRLSFNGAETVLGDLKGIRRNGKGKGKDKSFNNGFPYYKSQFIEYKAK